MFIALSDLDGFDLAPSEHEGAPPKKKLFVPDFFWTALELSKPFRLLKAFGSSNGQRNTFAFSPGQGRYELYGSVYGSNLQLVSLSTSKISPDT